MIKILLSFRHKAIPPSLHYERGNPAIDFAKSPFYVNTKLKDWDRETNGPRRAAISSFGFSGTNAHMVLEEAPEWVRRHTEKPGYLIVLSARTSEQLWRQAEQVQSFCEGEQDVDLRNMSYTLLTGRSHWNHRLACVARSRKELVGFLEKWLEKGKHVSVHIGELREGDHREQASLKRYGNQCVQECRATAGITSYLEHLATLAELYIQGYRLNFEGLLGEGYAKISLPTYPFARESYWVSAGPIDNLSRRSVAAKTDRPLAAPNRLHPLVHENTSDVEGQRFSSTFRGKNFSSRIMWSKAKKCCRE